MCDICMHSPCLSGCPNAPDPTPVTHCCSCGEPIIPGDEYGIIDGEAWCEDCLEDLPLCVLIPRHWRSELGDYRRSGGRADRWRGTHSLDVPRGRAA